MLNFHLSFLQRDNIQLLRFISQVLFYNVTIYFVLYNLILFLLQKSNLIPFFVNYNEIYIEPFIYFKIPCRYFSLSNLENLKKIKSSIFLKQFLSLNSLNL